MSAAKKPPPGPSRARPGRPDGFAPGERRTVLEGFNATARPVPEATLPELFEAQVARSPEATALVLEDEALSYRELNARANRLAHHLIGLGVGPESLVGIALERSPEMVTAVLATLKAGGAYLPLDPKYPPARLAHMLADATPAAVLSSSALQGLLPAACPVIALDATGTRATLRRAAAHDPSDVERHAPLRVHHPAYVIYTSGSTGVPKGVAVTHAGIPSLAGAQVEGLGLTAGSRVLQYASLNFDVSLWEIVMAFTTGAALVLLREEARSGAALAEVVVTRRVTQALLPPVVLPTLDEGDVLPLENLTLGGEACSGDLVRRWSPGRRMVNTYGPTESTVCATISAPLAGADTPPIGAPVWNTVAYVLDAALEPVPVGVAGELYLAGAGLARGYLRRPGLTAERFVADPHGVGSTPRRADRRMYRTGDLTRWRADGHLEFLGRVDQQVKIRGFRVELGEIEAVLSAQETVAQAAVAARNDGPGGRKLVAYLVPARDAVPDAAVLRRNLGERLPEYMMPAVYVTLDAFPVTPNGKLDRRALPAPAPPAGDAETFVAPDSELEQAVAAVWKQVLGVDGAGVHDNFFDLGGNSVTMAQVHAKLPRLLGRKPPIVKLFEHPTIAALARYLERDDTAAAASESTRRRAAARKKAMRGKRRR